jgi:outer membrane immunogenic protein
MNTRFFVLLGSFILLLGGTAVLAQETGSDFQKEIAKKDSSPESVVAKTGDPAVISTRSGGSLLPNPVVRKKRSAPPGDYDWTGFYIGGQVGYGWGNGDTRFDPLPDPATFINMQPTTLSPDPRGWLGGFQGGYNYQFDHIVIGGESSFSWTGIKGTVTQTPIIQNNGTPLPGGGLQTTTQDTDWFGTLRFRAGGAWDRVFIYGTVGLAYGKVNYSANTDFRPTGTTQYPAAFSDTKTGWTGGFGGEFAINRHWTVRTEYLFYDLGDATFIANPTPALPPFQVQYTWKTQAHTFNSGFNYRF